MQCPRCGQSINKSAEYCEHCGHKLSSEKPQKESPPPASKESGAKEGPSPSQGSERRSTEGTQGPRRSDRAQENGKGQEIDDEKRSAEEDDSKTAAPTNGFPWKSALVFAALVILAVVLFSTLGKDRPPPLPEKLTFTAGSEAFFVALRENVHRVGNAKNFYYKGLGYMGAEWNPATLPSTNPSTLPSQPSFLKAAENFALALENFTKANDTVEAIRVKPIEMDQEKCKNDFAQATNNFISASDTLNQIAKALYLGDPKKAGPNFVTDAKAKFEVADQSSTELLLGGCNGSYFKFLKSAPPSERELAFNAYKNFFGERFTLHQSAIELLMGYRASETAPAGPNL